MRQPFRTNIVGTGFPKSTDIAPVRMSAMQQNQGLNITLPKSQLGLNWFYKLENMIYEHGILRTRFGLTQIGTSEAAYGKCVGLTEFTTSAGTSYLVAFYPTTVRFWNGTSWDTAAGTYTLTGTDTDFFTWTGFNDLLVFSNGIDGTFKFDPVQGEINKIEDAPAAYHLTTFAGRLIASNIRAPQHLPSDIKWSVKGNEEDWDGIGSGQEGLLSTPGGTIDQQTGVFPISDYNALVIRTNSVWMMTASGNVEVPFTFERLFANFGSSYRYTLQAVPGGVMGVFNDNVYMISERDITPLGEPIVVGIAIPQNSTVDGQATLLMTSAYSQSNREYIIIPNSSVIGKGVFYRYNFDVKKWSSGNGADMRWAAYLTAAAYGLTIDSSPGNIEDAGTESIDSEVQAVGDNYQNALVFWFDTGDFYIEDRYQVSSEDAIISLGFIPGRNPQERITLTKLYLLYDSGEDVGLLNVQTLSDLGVVIDTDEDFPATLAVGPQVRSITAPTTGRNVAVTITIFEGSAFIVLDIGLDVIVGTDSDTWAYPLPT